MIADSNQLLLRWIEGAFPLGDSLAVGGGFADGTIFHHEATREFSACMDDACWQAILELVKRLASNECDARCASLVFENAILWVSTRNDGSWIGVFTSRQLSDGARVALRGRLDHFAVV